MGTTDKRYIQPASIIFNEPDEDYCMKATVRGYCLIINNVYFDNVFESRKGSDKDAYEFKDIFKKLGFQLEVKRNVTSDKMRALFKTVSLRCSTKHDALVVILLSHGTETAIYGTDCIEVELNDILNHFDNRRCSQMKGKPKVFIVQACRGRKTDFGINTYTFISQPDTQTTLTQQSQISQTIDRMPRWSESDKKGMPTRTDMLLCFSCHTGYNSIRNENEGSWLGQSLAHFIRTESYHHHLIDILNFVSRDLRNRKSTNGYKQVLEITTIGFDKHLYFNPGHFPNKAKELEDLEKRRQVESDVSRDSLTDYKQSNNKSHPGAKPTTQQDLTKDEVFQASAEARLSPESCLSDDDLTANPPKIPRLETSMSSTSTTSDVGNDVTRSFMSTRSHLSLASRT